MVLLFRVVGPYGLIHPTHSWMVVHYATSYLDFGFVKRGLVGSLIDLAKVPLDAGGLWWTQGVSLAISLAVIAGYFSSLRHANRLRLYALFVALPTTVLQWAFDFGRFDALLVAIFLASIMCLRRGWVVAVALLCTLGVLIHEVYGVLLCPALLFIRLDANKTPLRALAEARRFARANLFLALPFVALVAVAFFGRISLDEASYQAVIQSRIGTVPHADCCYFIWRNHAGESLVHMLTHHGPAKTLLRTTLFGVWMGALAVYLRCLQGVWLLPSQRGFFALAMVLVLQGVDYGRWVSLVSVATFVLACEQRKVLPAPAKLGWVFVLGPIGVTLASAPPLIDWFLHW